MLHVKDPLLLVGDNENEIYSNMLTKKTETSRDPRGSPTIIKEAEVSVTNHLKKFTVNRKKRHKMSHKEYTYSNDMLGNNAIRHI
jgi:hypothetical protein